MATNYRITFAGDGADVWAHGYAWNRVAALGADAELWETWGTYRLALMRAPSGWRIDGFTYKSKMTRGDDRVRTHQP
jgi:type VI protein secretion system component VasK